MIAMVIYHEKIALEVSGAKLTNVTINHGFYIGWFNIKTSALVYRWVEVFGWISGIQSETKFSIGSGWISDIPSSMKAGYVGKHEAGCPANMISSGPSLVYRG